MKKIQIQLCEARSLLPSDLNGYSDPYAVVYQMVGEKKKKMGKTPYLNRTLNPNWNYTLQKVMNVDYSSSILIKIYDNDNANIDDCLGTAKIELSSFSDGLWSDKWYRLFDDNLEHEVRGYVRVKMQILDPDADSFRDEQRRPNDEEVVPKRFENLRIIGDQQPIIPKPVEIYFTEQGHSGPPVQPLPQ